MAAKLQPLAYRGGGDACHLSGGVGHLGRKVRFGGQSPRDRRGSIGIAAVTTLLARGAQVHQALMVPHLTPYAPAYQYWLHVMQETLAAQSGSVTAAQQTLGLLYNMLTQQAKLWAFVDNFRLLGFLSLLCIPSVFFFKKVRIRSSSSALH